MRRIKNVTSRGLHRRKSKRCGEFLTTNLWQIGVPGRGADSCKKSGHVTLSDATPPTRRPINMGFIIERWFCK